MAGMSDFDVSITDFIQRFCLRAILGAPALNISIVLETICAPNAALFGRELCHNGEQMWRWLAACL